MKESTETEQFNEYDKLENNSQRVKGGVFAQADIDLKKL